MKALLLDTPSGPEMLRVAEVSQPRPGRGDMRVAVHAVGLNPVDYKLASAGNDAWTYPFILGLDVAGIVDEVGPGVDQWQPGDAVYYHGDLSRPGGYAEYTVVACHVAAPLPAKLSFVEAAALPCAGFTAYQAIHRKLHVQPKQTILIQGGAGGVGGFAVQLAAQIGAKVISTCSKENADWVRQLGAAETIDYRNSDVLSAVKQLTGGRGVDGIVDTVGSDSATAGLEMLAFGGGIVCVAGLPDFRRIRSFSRALSVHDIALGGAYFAGDMLAQSELASIGRELGVLASSGAVQPMLEEVVTLEEIPAALVRLRQRHVRGKIVAQLRSQT